MALAHLHLLILGGTLRIFIAIGINYESKALGARVMDAREREREREREQRQPSAQYKMRSSSMTTSIAQQLRS